MNLTVAYLGRSGILRGPIGMSIALAPNLRRDRVSFVGNLQQPLRFREAISALHDVVVSDVRYKPKDRSNYQADLAEQKKREEALRKAARQQARAEVVTRQPEPIPEGFETRFRKMRTLYWGARQEYANY